MLRLAIGHYFRKNGWNCQPKTIVLFGVWRIPLGEGGWPPGVLRANHPRNGKKRNMERRRVKEVLALFHSFHSTYINVREGQRVAPK
jgi:hypothetical protein